MEILFEILLEFVLPLVAEVFAEAAVNKLGRIPWVKATARVVITAILYFAVGAGAGIISLFIFPNAFARSSTLHGISLVITPVLGGLVMSYIAWLRVRTFDWTIRLEAFAYGFVFAFPMALIRLLFAQ